MVVKFHSMKIKLIPALYTVVTILALANCVRETDFLRSNEDENVLVVSGGFTDGAGPHVIRLTRPGDSNKQAFEAVTGAEVVLSDDQGNAYTFQEITPTDGKPSFYQLTGIQGVAGRIYTLDIQLPGGEHYRSRPETMPVRVKIDSVGVKGELFITNESNGAISKEQRAFAYAYATVPDQASGRYLRWDAEVVFIFNEIFKNYYPIPPPSFQCFVTNRISDQLIELADLSAFQPGTSLYNRVGKRKIDFAFEHRICFIVYQRTIGRNAYEYWKKIDQLISPTGTIFDAPPARVFGNVENLTDPGNPALGYFEISAIDTARVYTRDGLLGDEFKLNTIPYCQYDYTRWPPVNHLECDNCLLLPSSSLEIPPWWQ